MSKHRATREGLVAFLGAPSDWSGCYPPFDPAVVELFQICVKKARTEAETSSGCVKMLKDNLISFLPHADKRRLLSYVEEKIPQGNDGIRWLSESNGFSVSLEAENEVKIRGSKVEMKEYMAEVLKIEMISTEKDVKIRKALLQAAPRLCEKFGRNVPANLYIVVGAYYLNLTATAAEEVALEVDATAAGNGVGGEAASSRTNKAVATNRIALVRLLKYPTKRNLKQTQNGMTVSDGDDVIDSGIYAPHEALGSAEIDHEEQLESIADGSEKEVASWTIGEQVPLDSDDDIDSGIYAPHEALGSAEIDHEGQLELSIADGSGEPVAYWTIGEQVPLDSDDDIDSGIYTPQEGFASVKNDHE